MRILNNHKGLEKNKQLFYALAIMTKHYYDQAPGLDSAHRMREGCWGMQDPNPDRLRVVRHDDPVWGQLATTGNVVIGELIESGQPEAGLTTSLPPEAVTALSGLRRNMANAKESITI